MAKNITLLDNSKTRAPSLSMTVLFNTLRNCKILNKENFTLKSNSNKMMLCWVWGQYYLVLNKISTLKLHFLGLFTISK